jgi:predicted ATPase
LVPDNCEHLIEPVAALVRQLLARCPRVSVLATSREALSVDAERTLSVSPLATSAGSASPAVALFVERARAVASGFELARDPGAVLEICRRLDGIPLAIELAAARVRAMSPRQIRDRLNERFRLLGGSGRALGRHQTLEQAVQWSYDLLSETERAALVPVSVFAGGFTLEAAEAVGVGDGIEVAEVLDLVDSLLRKSLLTIEDSGDIVRYGMLETIRQFATDRGSGELEAARARHTVYFADETDRRFAEWLSPHQLEAYRWLELDMNNLRVAFRWALDRGDVDSAARIASNIGDMARFILRDEATNWAAEVVDVARTLRHRRLVVLLTWAASSAWAFQRLEEARRFGREALELLDDPAFDPFAWIFVDLAQVAIFEGDETAAVELTSAGAAHSADAHDRFCMAFLPAMLARTNRYEEAMRVADAALEQAKAAGVPSSIAVACWAYGLAFAPSDTSRSLSAWQSGLALARRSGNRFWETVIAIEIANLQAEAGEGKAALISFCELLAMSGGLRDSFFVASGLSALVLLFDRLGRSEAGATLYGALPKLIERGAFLEGLEEALVRARSRLGDAAFEAAIRVGAAMTLQEASQFARAEIEKALREF